MSRKVRQSIKFPERPWRAATTTETHETYPVILMGAPLSYKGATATASGTDRTSAYTADPTPAALLLGALSVFCGL